MAGRPAVAVTGAPRLCHPAWHTAVGGGYAGGTVHTPKSL